MFYSDSFLIRAKTTEDCYKKLAEQMSERIPKSWEIIHAAINTDKRIPHSKSAYKDAYSLLEAHIITKNPY